MYRNIHIQIQENEKVLQGPVEGATEGDGTDDAHSESDE